MSIHEAFRNRDFRRIKVIANGRSRPPKYARPDDVLYEFDEGIRITHKEGTHGVIVIGGLGRGKTASFILPMAQSMIEDGLGGLVIDVKNNMTPQIMALAKAAGRERDVVELGTHLSALPINLLSGLSIDEIGQILTAMSLSGVEHSRNIEWIHKSIRLASDVAFVLFHLGQSDERLAPSFTLLERCLSNHLFARKLYSHFLETAYDPDEYSQLAFVTRIKDEAFHVFTMKKESRAKNVYWEQLGYRVGYCRNALAEVTGDSSLLANFSSPTEEFRLKYKDILDQGKIVIMRFKPTQGRAAIILAKVLKEKFYRDAYKLLDDGGQAGKPFFFLADEFQDVISIDQSNAFDDFSWFSKAREFGCMNIVATQAMSSLMGQANGHMVNALLSNCSVKIFLQNDDPAADQFVRHFVDVNKALSQLGDSEALVSRYDVRERRQHVAHLHCSKAFRRTRDRLQAAPLAATSTNSGPGIVERMREIDEALFQYSLDSDLRDKPHHADLAAEFKDILDPKYLRLEYPEELQERVVETLAEYRRRFGSEHVVNGVAWVRDRWLYLDVPSEAPEEVVRYQRAVLERE